MTDLDKLEELAKAATPGPWEYSPRVLGLRSTTVAAVKDNSHVFYSVVGNAGEENASFIAAGNPKTVLALIADHRAVLARIAKVEELHQPYTKGTVRHGIYVLCDACGAEWPCDTKRALTEGENE